MTMTAGNRGFTLLEMGLTTGALGLIALVVLRFYGGASAAVATTVSQAILQTQLPRVSQQLVEDIQAAASEDGGFTDVFSQFFCNAFLPISQMDADADTLCLLVPDLHPTTGVPNTDCFNVIHYDFSIDNTVQPPTGALTRRLYVSPLGGAACNPNRSEVWVLTRALLPNPGTGPNPGVLFQRTETSGVRSIQWTLNGRHGRVPLSVFSRARLRNASMLPSL